MRIKKEPELLAVYHRSIPPEVCTKPNCRSGVFIRHEDGWQCLNCMKVIYSSQIVVADTARRQDAFS
ncbi:MAG: hypothetical protein R6T78_02345 [Dehalococcoidales bacterium]